MKDFFSNQYIKKYGKWTGIFLSIFIILGALVWTANWTLASRAQDKFLKNISIGAIDVGTLSMEEARSKIDKRIDFISRRGFVYLGPGKTTTIYPNISAMDSADSLDMIVSWDLDKSITEAQEWQKDKGLSNFLPRLLAMWQGKTFPLYYSWDYEQHREILESEFKDGLQSKEEASFEFEENNINIKEGNPGQAIDYEKALFDTKEQIQNLLSTDIELKVIKAEPSMTAQMIREKKDDILKIAALEKITFSYQDQSWEITNDIFKNWLIVKERQGDLIVGFDQEKLEEYLVESNIREEVDQPVQDAKFRMENDRVIEFAGSQNGQQINLEKTLDDLEKIANSNPENLEVVLTVDTIEPKIDTQEVNNLGIRDLLGVGESDFSGSPPNRLHNIRTGAAALDGVLIAPGEEFSLVEALGDIDAASGYLPELVIKGNKTIPEYGGGLCQIGTTIFRGTLQSGLPVTERRNHSYRVPYYEPAGTDATIYDPWPDYKFVNDTPNHILIQTEVDPPKVYFEFWGTDDNRQVMITEPIIYNIVAPPPTKIIKTTDLEPGQKKCTERAHSGADAKFDYSIQYPDQAEPVETTFYSHYVPWREVCLLGVTEEELAQENASTTPDGLEDDSSTTTEGEIE